MLRPPTLKKPRCARAPGRQLTAEPPTSISAPPVTATECAPSRLRFSGTRGHGPRQLCRVLCLLLVPLCNPPSLSSGQGAASEPPETGEELREEGQEPPRVEILARDPGSLLICRGRPHKQETMGGLSEGTRQMPSHMMSGGPGLPWTAPRVAHCTTPRSTIPKHGCEWCSWPRDVEVLGTPLWDLPSQSTTALEFNK